MKIYIDINGTIIYRSLEKGRIVVKTAKYLREFLNHILSKYEVYWLSTMCDGDIQVVIDYLRPYLAQDLLEQVSRIKPTSWKEYKIEAIDLTEDFLWFDDALMQKEEEILKKAGKLDRYVRVNHYKNKDFFKDWLAI